MQFQVRIKPIFTNSGVKMSIHHHQYWFCSGLGFGVTIETVACFSHISS